MPVQELTPLQAQQRENMHLLLGDPQQRRAGKDPSQQHINTMRKMLEKQIKDTGSGLPVTILNLNPTSLKISGGMFFPEEIEACPADQPYVIYVIRETRWGHKDQGVGLDNVHRVDPYPEIPKSLAAEYMRHYQQESDGFGGVLCYMGSAWNYDKDGNIISMGELHPSKIKKGDSVMVPVISHVDGHIVVDEEKRDFHEFLGVVRAKRNKTIMRKLQEAVSWHENPEQAKNVNDLHRDMARMAVRENLIPALPRFCIQENSLTEKQAAGCPSCQVVPKPGAIMCANCSYIIDVVEVFRLRPSECVYGSAEMDRLTPEQWKVVDAIHAERTKLRDSRKAKTQ